MRLRELSTSLGCDDGYLSRVERGTMCPSPAFARKITSLFAGKITLEQVLFPAESVAPAKKPADTQASSTAKVTPPAPGDVNTGYFLQVGAYKTQADAEQQRARLGFQGFESKVTQRDAGNVTYYLVRIGPFTKFEDMNNVRQRLSDAGVDTAVIRFSKQ